MTCQMKVFQLLSAMLLFAAPAYANQYEKAAEKMCSQSTFNNKNCEYLAGRVQVSTFCGLRKEGYLSRKEAVELTKRALEHGGKAGGVRQSFTQGALDAMEDCSLNLN